MIKTKEEEAGMKASATFKTKERMKKGPGEPGPLFWNGWIASLPVEF
jgi:hypothetical protein